MKNRMFCYDKTIETKKTRKNVFKTESFNTFLRDFVFKLRSKSCFLCTFTYPFGRREAASFGTCIKNKLNCPSLHTSARVSQWPAENPRGWGVAHGVSMDARTEFPKVTKISLNQKYQVVPRPPPAQSPCRLSNREILDGCIKRPNHGAVPIQSNH